MRNGDADDISDEVTDIPEVLNGDVDISDEVTNISELLNTEDDDTPDEVTDIPDVDLERLKLVVGDTIDYSIFILYQLRQHFYYHLYQH